MEVVEVKFSQLIVDESLQPRAKGLDEAHVASLMAAYESPDCQIPPMRVGLLNGEMYVVDFHRAAALGQLGREMVPVRIFDCPQRGNLVLLSASSNADDDIEVLESCGATSKKGLPRTTADKRRAVEMVQEAFPGMSQRWYADRANVHHSFVQRLVEEKQVDLKLQVQSGGDVASKKPAPKAKNEDDEGTETTTVIGANGKTYKPKKDKPQKNQYTGKGEQCKKRRKRSKKHKAAQVAEILIDDEPDDEPEFTPAPSAGKLETYYKRDGVPEMPGVYRPRFTKASNGQEVCLDAFDNPCPPACGDAFADPTLRSILFDADQLARASMVLEDKFNALKATRNPNAVYTWVSITDLAKHFGIIRTATTMITDTLRDSIPYAVCPECGGERKGCKKCKSSGYWPHSEVDLEPQRFRKAVAA